MLLPAPEAQCRYVGEWVATELRRQLPAEASELEALKVFADVPCTDVVVAYTPAPIVIWACAHGDLHLANITVSAVILGWERFGTAPRLGRRAALRLRAQRFRNCRPYGFAGLGGLLARIRAGAGIRCGIEGVTAPLRLRIQGSNR